VPTGIWTARRSRRTRRRRMRRRRRRRTALIKSNNPHLAGGEQLGMFANHDIVASPSNDLRREYDITARPVRYGFQPSQKY